MAKQRVFENRHSQDLRKTAIHENVLNLCLQRSEKNEVFAELQGKTRVDIRFVSVATFKIFGNYTYDCLV